MSTVIKDLGAVSAYAYAVEKGYTGTEAEFAELMADYAEVGQRAEDAANSALESKTAAQTAATTATNKASEAATSAQTATTKAGEATTAAGTATTAKNDAVAAKTAAETAQGKAEDAQAAAENVAESIPSDYSQLSEDVSDLKEDLNELLPSIKIKSLELNRYGVNESNGIVNNLPNRLHTAMAMCHKGDIVSVPVGYMFWIAYYTEANGYIGNSYAESGNNWSSDKAVIRYDGLFSINLKKGDNSDFTEAECYALNNTLFLYSTSEMRVNGIVFGAGHIITNDNSNWWSLHGDDYYYTYFSEQKQMLTTRWRTEERVSFVKGASIEIASGYRFYILEYVNGDVINVGWQTDRYVFGQDTTARIVIDTVSDTKIPYTAWPDLNDVVFIQNNRDTIILKNDIQDLKDREDGEQLYIGDFVNGHLTSSGVVDDSYTQYRISTPEIVAFPYGDKTKLKITINDGYLFAIRTGASANNLNNNLYWYGNGDVVDLPTGCNYYAVSVCCDSTDNNHLTYPITPADDIGLKITIQKSEADVILQNADAENTLSSARLFFSTSQLNTLDKYPVIAHTSDCHGDYRRVDNFLRFGDALNVDVACVTGDIVSYKPSHQIKWFSKLLLAHNTLPAVCTGNHDVYNDSMTDADIYDFMFADIAEKIGDTTGKTWYSKDIASKKLRVISVNLYQYGGTNRWYTHLTEEQMTWLVSTLQNTPNGYGVIILTHASQVVLDGAKNQDYSTFFQDERLYNNAHNSVSGGVPLYDIVDAFISRTTLSKTYTQTGSPASFAVSADFTNVDASVEFIAHLTGHFHQDSICYVPNTINKQLMLNVTCTTAIYGGSAYPYLADIQDQGRYNMDSSQDAFNVYVVDRDSKVVKVIRIGSNKTCHMLDRKYMAIPYAD